MTARSAETGLALYDRAAEAAAHRVIGLYSTSFGWASTLLGRRVRGDVRNVYALVRIADEIVDGPAREAGLSPAEELAALDELEAETARAVRTGFSANLVVHAFAGTARRCGIGDDLTAPFFASMRSDALASAAGVDSAAPRSLDSEAHDAYVYGSAEVVGLMCLAVFVNAGSTASGAIPANLTEGARRLGAAFQDINFLRDVTTDRDGLGRDYLGLEASATPAERARAWHDVLDRIDADLAAAARTIPLLPRDSRRAVTAAAALFAELAKRLRAGGESSERVRVPNGQKIGILIRALLGRPLRTSAQATSHEGTHS